MLLPRKKRKKIHNILTMKRLVNSSKVCNGRKFGFITRIFPLSSFLNYQLINLNNHYKYLRHLKTGHGLYDGAVAEVVGVGCSHGQRCGS